MQPQTKPTLTEQQITVELRAIPFRRTHACPEPDQWLSLLAQELDATVRSRLLAHLTVCAACRQEYRETKLAWEQTEEIRKKNLRTVKQSFPDTPSKHRVLSSFPTLRYARAATGAVVLLLGAVWLGGKLASEKPRQQARRLSSELDTVRQSLVRDQMRVAQVQQEKQALEEEKRRQQERAMQFERENNDLRSQMKKLKAVHADIPLPLLPVPSIAPQKIAAVQSGSTQTLGSGAARHPVILETPQGTFLTSPRPHFRWKAVPGALRYEVILQDSKDNAPENERMEGFTTTEWTPRNPLKRNEVYHWQVKAYLADQTLLSPRAKFRILDTNAGKTFARDHAQILALAKRREQAYLLDEAERLYRLIPEGDPSYPEAQKRLRLLRHRPPYK